CDCDCDCDCDYREGPIRLSAIALVRQALPPSVRLWLPLVAPPYRASGLPGFGAAASIRGSS
ncbi:MAG TPA: hypothetical protein VK183_06675, partial [Flavobacterium sp.]|nr:hypothetical protein [Flavobacterium sp.]